MKSSISRRFRRRPPTHDVANANKENKQEQSFFGETFMEPFFQPVTNVASAEAVHRKCTDWQEKEKKVQRAPDKKEEEENKVLKKKEEERLQRAPEKKEKEKLMKNEEKKEAGKVHKKESATSSANSIAATSNYIHPINGKGQSITPGVQSFFESRMGGDFGEVKIHTGKEAADSAREIHARAYTYGNNIVFNEDKYQPKTSAGKYLLAHELAHVLQQTGKVVHRKKTAKENDISESTPDPKEVPEEREILAPVFTSGVGTSLENNIAFANCSGVTVNAHTVANYDHGTYAASSTSVKRSKNCLACDGDACLTLVGNITSVFQANPRVTLPVVPSGLNECERTAVQSFINGTLSHHEQQHVAAFKRYNGTIMTPFSYTGCREGFDAYIQAIHDNIEYARITGANTISDALDPFSPVIPCNCPDPEPQAEASETK